MIRPTEIIRIQLLKKRKKELKGLPPQQVVWVVGQQLLRQEQPVLRLANIFLDQGLECAAICCALFFFASTS